MEERPGKIAIAGAGSIGTAWAIVFAAAGHTVALHDADLGRGDASLGEIRARLDDLAKSGLAGEPAATIAERISFGSDLAAVVRGAGYVQECISEDGGAKQALFARLEELADGDAILASSSSFMPASAFASGLATRSRCLVVHPGNPPYLLRVAEVVPAPFTDRAAVDRVMKLLSAVDMNPILVRGEIAGFVFNRLQGAVLREAYALVADGIVSAADIDRLVRDGLGLRWSVTGPFETVDLNTRGGIAAHAERMLPAYIRMGAERGGDATVGADTVARVVAERRAALPLEGWPARTGWRDRELMALLSYRRSRITDLG